MVNFTIAEKFYNTYVEFNYLYAKDFNDKEKIIIETACNILHQHLKDNDYELTEEETDIIGYATLIQEEKGE